MNITQILLGLILIVGAIIGGFIIPAIRARLSAEQIELLKGIAQTAVFAAEKIFGAKMGADKKAYAIKLVKKLLEKKNLTFDEEVIDAAIEAQVQQLGLDMKNAENGAQE